MLAFFVVSACVCVFRIFFWLYGRLQNLIAPCRLANAGGGFSGKWRGVFCIALLWGYFRGEAFFLEVVMRDGEMVWIGKGGRHGFGVERRGRLGCNFFFFARARQGEFRDVV